MFSLLWFLASFAAFQPVCYFALKGSVTRLSKRKFKDSRISFRYVTILLAVFTFAIPLMFHAFVWLFLAGISTAHVGRYSGD
jgi:hypothetical protein